MPGMDTTITPGQRVSIARMEGLPPLTGTVTERADSPLLTTEQWFVMLDQQPGVSLGTLDIFYVEQLTPEQPDPDRATADALAPHIDALSRAALAPAGPTAQIRRANGYLRSGHPLAHIDHDSAGAIVLVIDYTPYGDQRHRALVSIFCDGSTDEQPHPERKPDPRASDAR